MLSVDYLENLTEPVRDSWLQASFRSDGQKRYTIHTHVVSHRSKPKREIWAHEKDLGQGGFGLVQLQTNMAATSPPEYRVIKSVRVTEGDLRLQRALYIRELEALTKFSHKKYRDFFVKFYGWYDSPGWIHIAMEYFELGDLQSYLKNPQLCPHNRLPEDQAQDITSQLVDALSLMHGQNFAHRDLKPANILIKQQHPEQWWVKLCDLGLSKRVEDPASTVVRGTPGFMPPELLGFSKEPRNDSCLGDMWCLGELTYQALTGRATFETFADLGKYCAGLIQFPSQPLKDIKISEEAIGFIVALMKVKPSERLSAQSARAHTWMEISPGSQSDEGLNDSIGQSEWSLEVPFTAQTEGNTTASAEWTTTVTNPNVAPSMAPAADNPRTTTQMSTTSITSPDKPTNLFDLGWALEPTPVPGSSDPRSTVDLVFASQPDLPSSHSAVHTMTSDERQLYAQVFQQVDIYNLGVITGEAGVKFFDKTGLKPVTLGQIWAIGDVENRGFLTSDCFMIVLRLIGHAQAGREPTTDLAFQPGPRPRFNDSSSPPLGMLQVHHTSSSIQVPDLSPHRIAQYAGLFERLPLQGGIRLSKSEAQMIFKKSDLSDEILDRVWRLADSEGRTTLSRTEFIIAMHLITSIRAGDIKELPSAIPTKLYETAIQGLPASPQPSIDNGSHDDHLNTRSDPWAITPSERVGYDRAYHSIIEGDGPCVTGEVAANFFRGSGLSVDVLWKIWSLADTENRGELSCDEFAIAMHLAVKLRAGENLLPTALPESLVNTSRRGYT